MPDSVLQGIANLVAIGLERARVQDLPEQIEAARQSDHLRTTLIDAMAHEFKKALTLIKATTTALSGTHRKCRRNGRLDITQIDVHPEISSVTEVIREVVGSMHNEIDDRPVKVCLPR